MASITRNFATDITKSFGYGFGYLVGELLKAGIDSVRGAMIQGSNVVAIP